MRNIIKSALAYSLLISMSAMIGACEKREVDENEALRSRFEGKYKIVRATADKSVDLDFDGDSSADLLHEIEELKHSYLSLRLNAPNRFIYAHFWQNQSVMTEAPPGTRPVVTFANQGAPAHFTFNENLTRLHVATDIPDPAFPLPLSVEILPKDILKVLMTKNVYTDAGWVDIEVEVTYERFTTVL